eukprot:4616771-Pyramimonas_sp.AAC.1
MCIRDRSCSALHHGLQSRCDSNLSLHTYHLHAGNPHTPCLLIAAVRLLNLRRDNNEVPLSSEQQETRGKIHRSFATRYVYGSWGTNAAWGTWQEMSSPPLGYPCCVHAMPIIFEH